MSDDGTLALVVIAMLGNVFSPAYAAARAAAGPGRVDPLRYSAVNVALYGRGVRRWVLTERDAGAVRRSPREIAIGPSTARWEGDDLVMTFDERTSPGDTSVAGALRVTPAAPFTPRLVPIDGRGRHLWTPIAPRARISVHLEAPRLSFEGQAYVDTNAGDEPLEASFSRWSWWRVEEPGGALRIGYRAELRGGAIADASCRLTRDGSREARPAGAPVSLGLTRWGVERRAETGVQLVRTLEDTPFYARSLVRRGSALGVHETVSLDRFKSWWVQRMIPYRMRREEAPA